MIEVLEGDAVERLRELPGESVQCVVTSPPYWGLRDYSSNGQLGLERTPEEYVAKMVAVFREVRRVLRKDGTLWLNLGDSYAGGGNNSGNTKEISEKQGSNRGNRYEQKPVPDGLKPKDLCGIPWRVAFALQADGWWLRSDIIWAKPNPMPESVTDRCCKSHEYLFMLTKSERYFFDSEAIKEDSAQEMGSQMESESEGEGSSQTLLLFREGAVSEETLSGYSQADRGTEGAIQGNGTAKEARSETQGTNSKVLAKRERAQDESVERQALSENDQREMGEAPSRIKAQVPTQTIHADTDGMGSNQGIASTSVRVLQREETVGEGSRNRAIEERPAHEGECGSGVSALQRSKRKSDAQGTNGRNVQNVNSEAVRRDQSCSFANDPRLRPNAKRTKRSVWTVATAPYPEAHFATYPPDLIKPCIMAGTSAKGCCARCGAPWERQVESTRLRRDELDPDDERYRPHRYVGAYEAINGKGDAGYRETKTLGWQPTCKCDAGVAPCVVLDPFAGSGTTGAVALELGRKAVLIELNPKYVELIEERCNVTMGLALA